MSKRRNPRCIKTETAMENWIFAARKFSFSASRWLLRCLSGLWRTNSSWRESTWIKTQFSGLKAASGLLRILSCGLSLKFFGSPQISSSKIISRNYLQGRGISFRLRIPSDYLIGKGTFPNGLKHLSISVFRPFHSLKHGGAGQNSDKHLKWDKLC